MLTNSFKILWIFVNASDIRPETLETIFTVETIKKLSTQSFEILEGKEILFSIFLGSDTLEKWKVGTAIIYFFFKLQEQWYFIDKKCSKKNKNRKYCVSLFSTRVKILQPE